MKAIFSFVAVLVLSLSMAAQSKSFYDFSVKTIDGKEYKLADLKGKKVLVVNVASKCGLTPQYAELQENGNWVGFAAPKESPFSETIISWIEKK